MRKPLKTFDETLNEVLITFGGKKETQFGQIVILAGGAGSGKGVVRRNLIGIEGKVFDIDAFKKLAFKAPGIKKQIMDKYGKDLDKMSLGNPEDAKDLYFISKELNLKTKAEKGMANSILIGHPDRKPNIIFDNTLSQMSSLEYFGNWAETLGYKKENIHIVWVLNDINIALIQNRERERKLGDDIIYDTHRHVSNTMKSILKGTAQPRKYMDGYFIIVPNLRNVDNSKKSSPQGGEFFDDATYFIMKEKSKDFKPFKEIDKDLLIKLKKYTPKDEKW